MKRKRKAKRRRPSLIEQIQITSSKHLESLARRLHNRNHGNVRAKIQDELVARDLKLGGPHKNWGHG